MREVSKDVVETLLEGELTDHLGFEKHEQKAKVIDNSRNGYTPKTVKSKFGEIGLDVPRDRRSEFESQIVKKRKKDISGLKEKIISMYAKGMTTRDIQAHIKDLIKKISHQVIDLPLINVPPLNVFCAMIWDRSRAVDYTTNHWYSFVDRKEGEYITTISKIGNIKS